MNVNETASSFVMNFEGVVDGIVASVIEGMFLVFVIDEYGCGTPYELDET